MDIKMKKTFVMTLLMTFVMTLFLVGTASALDFDNVLIYEEDDMKVKFVNAFGLGEELGTIELKSHKTVDEVRRVGYGKEEVVIYYDPEGWELNKHEYGTPEFTNMETGEIEEKDYYFVEWKEVEFDIPDYKTNCNSEFINGTGSDCLTYASGSHKDKRFEWVRKEDKKVSNLRTGVKVFVEEGDYYDIKLVVAGKKVKKHAVWDTGITPIAYYTFNETTGSLLSNWVNDSFDWNLNNMENADWSAGKLNNGLFFGGTDEFGTMQSGNLTIEEEGTINVWTNLTSGGLMGRDLASRNDGDFDIGDDGGGKVQWISDDGSSQTVLTTDDVHFDGTIRMFTFIWNSTGQFIFVDSVMKKANAVANAPSLPDWWLGGVQNQGKYMVGMVDEMLIDDDGLSQAELDSLYNDNDPPGYLELSADPVPTINLDSPANHTNFTTNNVVFNATIFDDVSITNVSLILDHQYNETNLTAGVNNSLYTFNKNLGEGNHTWTMEACDSESHCINATKRTLNVNTTPNIVYGAGVPATNFNTTNNFIEINVTLTEDFFQNVTFDLYNFGGSVNRTVTFTNSSREKNWTNLISGKYSYNTTTVTSTNQINVTETRTFTSDSSNPALSVFSPPAQVDYHAINTNLFINWSANDTNLDSCIYNYNTTNMTVVCSDNQTTINITSYTNTNLTFWVNDTFGNMNRTFISWEYKIFQHSISFAAETIEGSTESFILNATILVPLQISEASLIYNDVSYPGSYTSSTGNTTVSLDLNIPNVAADSNLTFYWSFVLSDSSIINTSSHNQSVLQLEIDDCDSFTNKIYIYNVVDEENSTLLSNTTIEIDLNILSPNRASSVLNFSQLYDNENPAEICLNINLSNVNYSLDTVVKYENPSHAIEYYNIANYTLTNSSGTQNITLYDLVSTDSTEFQLTFTGAGFQPVEGALVFVERQYISEGIFKTVELPRTDSNGQTVLHLVRNDVIYNLRIVKDGIVLKVHENIIAFCEDFTIGDCQINLNVEGTVEDIYNYDTDLGITFSGPNYNETSSIMSFNFAILDGTTKTVLMNVTRNDIFGNRTICNHTLTSASGTLFCIVDPNIDDTTLNVNIFVEGDITLADKVQIDSSNYGSAGYLIYFLMAISLILIFSGSKNEILFGMFLSLAGAVGLGLTSGTMIGLGASGIWLLVMILVGMWKLNKDRQQ